MIKKTLCTFCSFGCELGIEFDDFGIKGVEYLKDTPNNGRVCPRGSASAVYLDHPKRLCVPVAHNKYAEPEKIMTDLKKILTQPDSIAVAIDRNVTIEEENAIIGFCTRYNIKNIVSSYFEPESLLRNFVEDKPGLTLENITRSQMIVVFGDIFNYAPMISKSIINWKLSDRKNRLVVIDSLVTHTSYFATDFIMTRPGMYSLMPFALVGKLPEGIDSSVLTAVPEKVLRAIAKDLKEAGNGLIIATLPFAHSYHPELFPEGLQVMSEYTGKRVMPIFEFVHANRLGSFAKIINLINDNEIKYLINFGELFPFYYPQIQEYLRGVNIYATSVLRFKNFVQLPVALNIEKTGSFLTTFGPRSISGIKPASGAHNIIELLNRIGSDYKPSEVRKSHSQKIAVETTAKKMLEKSARRHRRLVILGEKSSYNYLGLLEPPLLKINPVDAKENGIRPGDWVVVESERQKVKVCARITDEVPEGYLFTQPETPDVRGIFDIEIEDGLLNFVPAEVKVWQEE